VPIVFAGVSDPVGGCLVATLARPGGNITGFALPEYGISVKWLELLKEMAPRVTRAAIVRDPTVAVGIGQLGAIQSVAPSFGVEANPIDVRDAGEIERAVTAFAWPPNGVGWAWGTHRWGTGLLSGSGNSIPIAARPGSQRPFLPSSPRR
jgi:putative ABC transport system substrate-binding protein